MVGWYENEQKVGRRDVRAKPFRGTMSGIKPKNDCKRTVPLQSSISLSLIERAVATVCLQHAIKGLSFQHILLTHKTLSFFIPMMGEFLNMNPHSRCTPGKKNSLLKMPMSDKNSHKRFQPKTREIKLRGQAGARASCRGMSGLCCYDSTRGTPSRRRPSYRHATRGSTHYQDR